MIDGDAANFDVIAHDLVNLKVSWSRTTRQLTRRGNVSGTTDVIRRSVINGSLTSPIRDVPTNHPGSA